MSRHCRSRRHRGVGARLADARTAIARRRRRQRAASARPSNGMRREAAGRRRRRSWCSHIACASARIDGSPRARTFLCARRCAIGVDASPRGRARRHDRSSRRASDRCRRVLARALGPGGRATADYAIIVQTRIPRVLLAAVVGASSPRPGCGFQGLLANPLADPHVLGISGGAAVAGAAALVLGHRSGARRSCRSRRSSGALATRSRWSSSWRAPAAGRRRTRCCLIGGRRERARRGRSSCWSNADRELRAGAGRALLDDGRALDAELRAGRRRRRRMRRRRRASARPRTRRRLNLLAAGEESARIARRRRSSACAAPSSSRRRCSSAPRCR